MSKKGRRETRPQGLHTDYTRSWVSPYTRPYVKKVPFRQTAWIRPSPAVPVFQQLRAKVSRKSRPVTDSLRTLRALANPFNTVVHSVFPVRSLRGASVCVLRKARREIMHALGHAGSGGLKKPRYTEDSKITCVVRRRK